MVMAVDISYAEVPLLPTVSSSSHTIYTTVFLAVASWRWRGGCWRLILILCSSELVLGAFHEKVVCRWEVRDHFTPRKTCRPPFLQVSQGFILFWVSLVSVFCFIGYPIVPDLILRGYWVFRCGYSVRLCCKPNCSISSTYYLFLNTYRIGLNFTSHVVGYQRLHDFVLIPKWFCAIQKICETSQRANTPPPTNNRSTKHTISTSIACMHSLWNHWAWIK